MNDPGKSPGVEDPPPFLGTWTRLYAVVLGWLGLVVLLMHLFTLHYR